MARSVADIAARFGITETAVKQRLKLARVSPMVFEAYREGELTLEQVQAFAVTDDHAAQERVFEAFPDTTATRRTSAARSPRTRFAAPTSARRFVTVAAYEEAGGAVRRDLFAEGDEGVFLLDAALLDHLGAEKLQAEAEALKAEGWKWVEAVPELDYEARGEFRVRHPEPLPLSEAAQAEQKQLAEEYDRLFNTMEEGDEETSARLDEIEARISELEETEYAYTPDVLAIAGAIVTIGRNGEPEILRGIVRPEDEPEEERQPARPRPEFSAALVESLTEAKSAAIGASLAGRPDIALAAVVHALTSDVFHGFRNDNSLRISGKFTHLKEEPAGAGELKVAYEKWFEKLPKGDRRSGSGALRRTRPRCWICWLSAPHARLTLSSERRTPWRQANRSGECAGNRAESRHDEVVHADGGRISSAVSGRTIRHLGYHRGQRHSGEALLGQAQEARAGRLRGARGRGHRLASPTSQSA